jgi:N-acetylmuramoyl-L-alanine amidase
MIFKKPKRLVKEVFLHHSANDLPANDDVSVMDRWHNERGYNGVGYHFYIKQNGAIQKGRDLERKPAAQKNHNWATIAICLGGVGQSFTKEQFESMRDLCTAIATAYDYAIVFRGHKEVFPTVCPHFDYKEILGLDENQYMKKPIVEKNYMKEKKAGWWTRLKRLLFLN